MSRTIVAGLDGSPESRAAAEWAAREAGLRGLPLRLLHVREREAEAAVASLHAGSSPDGGHWSVLSEAAEGLRLRHTGVGVVADQRDGRPVEVLADAADHAELLALGSRGLGPLGGFLVGSVGLGVVARARRPVVLVRAGEQAADEHAPDPAGIPSAATPYRPVLLGVDAARPDAEVIGFAFAAAALRGTGLRAVHGWNLPPYYVHGLPADPALYDAVAAGEAERLAKALRPWRERYPQVEVAEDAFGGSPSVRLVEASREASLVVMGRRIRRGPLGGRIGSLTHAVLHHAAAPVAVVPHT
ncbi:universal stress protein [Streptomyces sp. H28]|uniref:universal stress protein n=1 Tax=Streptomyces sp. H28 TaxID=2775865 RepID=UPI00177DCAB3|nr:universal stress protein [Streptomyces sp. H28]MBD9734770.1 universal stress protein [Streptomyces sp. H28]